MIGIGSGNSVCEWNCSGFTLNVKAEGEDDANDTCNQQFTYLDMISSLRHSSSLCNKQRWLTIMYKKCKMFISISSPICADESQTSNSFQTYNVNG